jgi:hypothetical protein
MKLAPTNKSIERLVKKTYMDFNISHVT